MMTFKEAEQALLSSQAANQAGTQDPLYAICLRFWFDLISDHYLLYVYG